ncbi:MAG: protein kinase [Myxococcota bacterium]
MRLRSCDELLSEHTRIGAYEVVNRLGGGGMGEVYRARHSTLGGDFALKVLNLLHPAIQSRFADEGRFQSTLHHPNVVRVYGVEEHRGLPVLVMEFVEGGTLEAFVRRRWLLDEMQIDSLARGILRGLRAVHRFGLVHRDIKPANILLQPYDDDLIPKIGDFGLAKVLGGGAGSTHHGARMGTLNYMAPEQFVDARAVDHRADIFAVGCVLYEMVTGQQAFPGDDPGDVEARIRHGSYAPIPRIRPDCPERMWRAIDGALAPDPERRTPDCQAFEQRWAGTRPPVWPPPWTHDTLRALRAERWSDSDPRTERLSAATVVLTPEPGEAPEPAAPARNDPPVALRPIDLVWLGFSVAAIAAGVTGFGVIAAVAAVMAFVAPRASVGAIAADPSASASLDEASAAVNLSSPAVESTIPSPPVPNAAEDAGVGDPAEAEAPDGIDPGAAVLVRATGDAPPARPARARPPGSVEPPAEVLLTVTQTGGGWGTVEIDGASVATAPTRRLPLAADASELRIVHSRFGTVKCSLALASVSTVAVHLGPAGVSVEPQRAAVCIAYGSRL